MKCLQTVIYAIIFMCLINCSNEDDALNISFTEKFDGTIWRSEDGWNEYYGNDFLRIINDNNSNLNPFEEWVYLSLDDKLCYFHIRYDLYGSINENLNNTFQYEYSSRSIYGYTTIYHTTIKVNGTTLRYETKRKTGNGDWWAKSVRNYYRSYENVDSLPACAN